MAPSREPLRHHVEPCGCIVKKYFGHTNTLMCERHQREAFGLDLTTSAPNNFDLIGG